MRRIHSAQDARTPEEAIVWLAECLIATADGLATTKSSAKHERERAVSIAQGACDMIERFNINRDGTWDNQPWLRKIMSGQTVKHYCDKMREKYVTKKHEANS